MSETNYENGEGKRLFKIIITIMILTGIIVWGLLK